MNFTLDELLEAEAALHDAIHTSYTAAHPRLIELGWIKTPAPEQTEAQIVASFAQRRESQRRFSMARVTTGARRRWKGQR